MPGVVRVPDFHTWGRAGSEPVDVALRDLEDVIQLRGRRRRSRRSSSRPVVGTNGILIPPDGYMQGVRELCDTPRHPAHRRRGDVPASAAPGAGSPIDHWGVVPDLMTMAKGLTSAYVPAGRGGHAARDRRGLPGEACSPAASPTTAIRWPARRRWPRSHVYEEDGLIEHAPRDGHGDARALAELEAQAPVGRGGREHRPVRDRRARPRPRDLRADGAVQRHVATRWRRSAEFFREKGLYTFVRWNTFFTNPPLTHHRGRAARGLRDHRPRARRRPTRPWRRTPGSPRQDAGAGG